MKSILVLGCSNKQINYLKVLKKNFKIILLDKNINSPGKKFSSNFFKCSYTDIVRLKYLYKKKLLRSDYIFTASSQYAFLGLQYLAYKLGLKNFPSKKSISIVLNKNKFYNFLKQNRVNFPQTRKIINKNNLKKYIKIKDTFFLKSDLGKSPYYIYKGTIQSLLKQKINWRKNQFFNKYYLLQKNFIGTEIRVNIFKNQFLCFYFKDGQKISFSDQKKLKNLGIIKRLFLINKKLNIHHLLVKYDIIVSDKSYVVIDIGLDPPQRMLNNFTKLNKNFYKFYINFFVNLK